MQNPRALALIAGAALTLALGASCVDSELSGSLDTSAPGDTALEDGGDGDVGPSDASDAADGADTTPILCRSAEDCRGLASPCREPVCLPSGVCDAPPREGCCEGDQDCTLPPGGDACRVGRCPAPGGQCVIDDTCPPCLIDADCAAHAPQCSAGRCSEGLCYFDRDETCCLTAADCDDADPCTVDGCGDGGVCAHRDVGGAGCCEATPVLATSFSPAPPGLEQRSTSPLVAWQVYETRSTPSPPAALYLGRPDRLNATSPAPYIAEASFPLGPVQAGSDVEVKLALYVDVRPDADVDRFRVFVRLSSGEERLVYTKGDGPLRAWHPVKRAVTVASGGNARLVLAFDSVTALTDERYLGVLVDDLQVRTGCGAVPACTSDAQCATDDPCTLGRCVGGSCAYARVEGCCTSDAQCGGGDLCHPAACVDNRCLPSGPPLPGCCTTDQDCAQSGDPCFLRAACVDARCELVPAPVACDDGDPCTADACAADGRCVFSPIPGCCTGAGCACVPEVARYTWGGGDEGWTYDPPNQGFGWRRLAVPQLGEALYFGNPAGQPALDPGFPMQAAARSPLISLPAGAQSVSVSFSFFLAAARNQALDAIRLEAVAASGQTVLLWQRGPNTPRNALRTVTSAALSPLRGQAVTLRWVYEAHDSAKAQGQGFVVDDLAIEADCSAPICQTASDCPLGPACTVRACEGGACTVGDLDCDDHDPCTLDRCDPATGGCAHTASGVAGCPGCTSEAQCRDDDPCTLDACVGGQCVRAFDPSQPGCGPECTFAADCADGDPCTSEVCESGLCRRFTDPTLPGCGGCTNANDCRDGDPCTTDRCQGGECTHETDFTAPGCGGCNSASDCRDGSVCTEDVCDQATHRCQFLPIAGCCTGDAQCGDGDVCTTDRCERATGTCRHEPRPGCCASDAACDDDDPCTVDSCTASGACVHTPLDSDACSVCDLAACDDGDPCTTDSCNSATGGCDHAAIAGCCTRAGQCGDGDYCTFDRCQAGRCVHDWLPLPGCQPACQSDQECEDGNPCTTNSCGPSGRCQTVPIFGCCTSAAQCSDGNACTQDTCLPGLGFCLNTNVSCNDDDPCTADSCDPAAGCLHAPIAGCCASPADCQDGDACTIDGCVGGRCTHAPAPSCCEGGGPDGSCDDGYACTTDACVDGACQNTLIPGCCTTRAECGDGRPCTQDRCVEGRCVFVDTGDCCQSASDCADGDPCTTDVCQANGSCAHGPNTADPQCCVAETHFQQSFPAQTNGGFDIQRDGSGAGFRISALRSSSAPFSMWYGDPQTGNYQVGARTFGTLTSPPIAVPSSSFSTVLEFRVWLDVDPAQNADLLSARVVTGGNAVAVWERTSVGATAMRRWVPVSVALPTAVAGRTIRVQFYFDSVDAAGNLGQGVFIDDITVRAVCAP